MNTFTGKKLQRIIKEELDLLLSEQPAEIDAETERQADQILKTIKQNEPEEEPESQFSLPDLPKIDIMQALQAALQAQIDDQESTDQGKWLDIPLAPRSVDIHIQKKLQPWVDALKKIIKEEYEALMLEQANPPELKGLANVSAEWRILHREIAEEATKIAKRNGVNLKEAGVYTSNLSKTGLIELKFEGDFIVADGAKTG